MLQGMMLFLLAALLTGCAGPQVKLAFQAGSELNPDLHHQSLPVVTRVYLLKDKQAFETASFAGLWKHDKEILGSALLRKEEILLTPSEKKTLVLKGQEGAEYLGVVALFRDYKGGEWRTLSLIAQDPLHQCLSQKVKLTLNNNQLKLTR
jgi:type VI secretion system protein VasD